MNNPDETAPIPALTKELLARCRNEGLVSYAGLLKDNPDVAAAIAAHTRHRQRYIQWTNAAPEWRNCSSMSAPVVAPNYEGIYRLDPNAPTQRKFWDSTDVMVNQSGIASVCMPNGRNCYVSSCLAHRGCVGIWYEKDGVRTLRTDMNLAYGRIVGVRFEVD